MATDGVTAAPEHALDVSDLEKFASPSIMKRVNEADTDKDGVLSVQELIQLVQSEQKAHADRRLFRNFLIALVVAVLILVAALVGAVYGIVKLTDEVDDSNGVLVSAKTGNVMATGKATDLLNLSQLYAARNRTADDGTIESMPDVLLAEQLEVLVVPQIDGGYHVHRVASVRSLPAEQRAIIVSEDGSIVQVGTTGLRYLKDPIADSLTSTGLEDASPGRRLFSDDTQTGYGVRSASDSPSESTSNSCDKPVYHTCVRVYECYTDPVRSRNVEVCKKMCYDRYC